MLIRNIMKKDVITVTQVMTINDAAQTMLDNHIGSLVIVKNNFIVGIITERDILRSIAASELHIETVEDIMTRYVYTVSPGQKVDAAISLMKKYKVKKLPVVEGRSLKGIITATDIIVAMPSHIPVMTSLIRGS